MSEMDEVFTIFKKYWKILLKWIFRLHDYPEISVEELYKKFNSGDPPLMIDTRTVEDYE